MPVIVLTGHGDVTIAVQAMKAGAVDFLEKPFEKAVLITAIETAFERLADAEGRAGRAADATILIAGLSAREQDVLKGQIGRAHVCTPVTNAHLVCRLLLAHKKTTNKQ